MRTARKATPIGLRPPEGTYFDEIRSTVGNDPLVRVDPLVQLAGGSFLITLHVKGLCKARALATLLVRERSIGGVRILVRVRTGTGMKARPLEGPLSPRRITALYRAAFRTNRLFSFAAARKIFGVTYVYPVFKVDVIQFANDDLSDYYGNYNNLAAYVFRDVLRNTVGATTIQFSTALKKRKGAGTLTR